VLYSLMNKIKLDKKHMISVTEAKKIIRENSSVLSPKCLPLLRTLGLVLAEDIFSQQDHPHFDQAAMDGYAFCFDASRTFPALTVKGESAAGTTEKIRSGEHEAVRIFTGAPVPPGTDTVVMQEKVSRDGNKIVIQDELLRKGGNVRPAGSEIRAGEMALPKGTLLSPAAIGFLASLGKEKVSVLPAPQVSIIVTGTELQDPGLPLQYGQVYESNSFALSSALQQLQITEIKVIRVIDDPEAIQQAVRNSLELADLVLITGGVSTGDYDYVAESLEQCGVERLFHKVKQKPGKPLYFGKKDKILVFGLPGNPSSVLTCFYEYVTLAIQYQRGLPKSFLRSVYLPMATYYKKKPGLTHFLKGVCFDNEVLPLPAQESFRMRSFALADCLIVLQEEKTLYEKGELVEIHQLPL
jgi:molybdopterin molybdotransferase